MFIKMEGYIMKHFNRYFLAFIATVGIFTSSAQCMKNRRGTSKNGQKTSEETTPQMECQPVPQPVCQSAESFISSLIDTKVLDPKNYGKDGITALMIAAQQGNDVLCHSLLDGGFNATDVDKLNQNLWHYAVIGNNVYIIQMFAITFNLDLNQKSKTGKTPLMLAIESRQKDVVEELIKGDVGKRQQINIVDNDGNSALLIALINNVPEAARMLLERFKAINKEIFNKEGLNALLIAIEYSDNTEYAELSKMLIESGANVNVATPKKWTPLHYASKKILPELIILLLDKGADKNARTQGGMCPFHFAAQSNLAKARLTPDTNTTSTDKFQRRSYMARIGKFLTTNIPELFSSIGKKRENQDGSNVTAPPAKKPATTPVAPVTTPTVPQITNTSTEQSTEQPTK
jgi:ankyrin repeat protein